MNILFILYETPDSTCHMQCHLLCHYPFRRILMPVVQCPVCQQHFSVPAYHLRRGRGIYCSRACFAQSRKKEEKHTCQRCGALLTSGRNNALYCSRACAIKALYANDTKKRTCAYCNRTFTAKQHNERFCSRLCEVKNGIAQGTVRLMHDPWKNGNISPVRYDADYWRGPDEYLGF